MTRLSTALWILAALLTIGCGGSDEPTQETHAPLSEPPSPRLGTEDIQARVDSALAFVEVGHLLRRADEARLQRQGLGHPIKSLVASLLSNPGVIPIAGTLGGTMRFIPDQIHVLSPPWVYAEFEDGHNMAHGVFRYEVEADSTINWEAVTASVR